MQDPQSWISDMNSHEMADQLNARLQALLRERDDSPDAESAAPSNPNDDYGEEEAKQD